MADTTNTTNDDSSTDAAELDLTDDEAVQLLADADAKNSDIGGERGDAPDPDAGKDWRSEAERWKRLSRKNEQSVKELAEKLRKYEDANKTEAQRLQEALDSHKTRAERAEAALKRREIAEEHAPPHATLAQIKAVAKRLAGDTDEELAQDAQELFALLAPAPATPKTPARPKERLRGGSEPDEDVDETDPRKLANLLPRRQ